MKCQKCGYENSDDSMYCSRCGTPLNVVSSKTAENKNLNYAIIILIVIAILVVVMGLFAVGYFNPKEKDTRIVLSNSPSQHEISTSSPEPAKSWKLVGSYSGSGSGSQLISVPAGKIKVSFSGFPIENYASNYLYVSGEGTSSGVDWGPTSAVASKSSSISFNSASPTSISVDYYELASWSLEVYQYK